MSRTDRIGVPRAGRRSSADLFAVVTDRSARRSLGQLFATTAVPFVLIVYLALRGGGYDAVVRSEVGVAVWWIVLLGAVAGVLPLVRTTRNGWIVLGLLAAVLAWTALALLWTESSERTTIEIARISTYLGVLALAISVQGPGSLRRTVGAVAAACTLIGLLALLSRLHPAWFPEDRTADVLDYARARLNYPLNYWNGLAYLLAMAIPLLLAIAVESRRILVQAAVTAAVPALALTCFFTISRGGAVALAIATATMICIYPRRLALLPTLLLAIGGSAILIVAATQRDALEDGLSNAAAAEQGEQMIAVVLVVCVAVALLRAAIGLAARYELGPRPHLSRRTGLGAAGAMAMVAIVGAIAVGAPAKVSDAWQEFKAPAGPEAGDTTGRFESASGNGRYQWWESAVDAAGTAPLQGIGPGTFEFWWAREGTLAGFVRDAHSLYLESLGELGIPGALLILALIGGVLVLGIRRALAGDPEARPWAAAAAAGCVAFAIGSAFDWTWELAVLPVVFLCLAAAIVQGGQSRPTPDDGRLRRPVTALAAVGAVIAIGVPLLGARAVDASRDAVDEDDLPRAASEARTARDFQPWAATPPRQEALVLQLQGRLDEAASAARTATAEEPTNWRTWYVLSEIERARGNASAAAAARDRAASLNPRSDLFE